VRGAKPGPDHPRWVTVSSKRFTASLVVFERSWGRDFVVVAIVLRDVARQLGVSRNVVTRLIAEHGGIVESTRSGLGVYRASSYSFPKDSEVYRALDRTGAGR